MSDTPAEPSAEELNRLVLGLAACAEAWGDNGPGALALQAEDAIIALRTQLAEARRQVSFWGEGWATLEGRAMRAEAEVARLTEALAAERANGDRLAEAGQSLVSQAHHVEIGARLGNYDIRGSAIHLGEFASAFTFALAAHRARLSERGSVAPHEYQPDPMMMGDCTVCGNTREMHTRIPAPKENDA